MRDTGELSYLIGDDERHYYRILFPEAYVFAHSRHTFVDLKYHKDEDYSPDYNAPITITVTCNFKQYTETKYADMNGSVKFDIGAFLRAFLDGTMKEDSIFDYSQYSKMVSAVAVTVTLKYNSTQFWTEDFEVVNGADEYVDDWWKDERRLHWWYSYPFTFDYRNLDEAGITIGSGATTVGPLPQITPDSMTYSRIRINPKVFASSATKLEVNAQGGMGFSNGSFNTRANKVVLIGHACARNEKDVYLRWLNRHGELNYWLFHRYSMKRSLKDNEHTRAFINDIWPEDTLLDNADIRNKTATRELTAYSGELDGFDYEIVRQLFTAPFVDMFERVISTNNYVWQRVQLKAETQTEALRHADKYTRNRQVVITLVMPEEGQIYL